MQKINVFLASIAIGALWCASAVADDLIIIPGKSIGPVMIGMTADELYRAMGEPKASKIGDDITSYSFEGLEVGVENDDQVVDRIFATSPRYKLERGVSVGSSALALVAAYGEPEERHETENGDKTLCYGRFEAYVRDGKVVAIFVSKGGCGTGFLYYLD